MWPPRALVASLRAHALRLRSSALRAIPVKVVTRGWLPGTVALRRVHVVPRDDVIEPRAADAPALVTFTSGSTGRPKAAVRTHGVLLGQLEALRATVVDDAGARALVGLPIVVLLDLATGAETVLPDADLRRPDAIDAGPVLAQVARHAPSRIVASPAILERLLDGLPPGDRGEMLHGVRTIVTGGGPVFPDLVARLARAAPGARIVAVYGSTEAEPIAHISGDEISRADEEAMRGGAGLLVGAPDSLVDLRIIASAPGRPIPVLDPSAFEAMCAPAGDAGEIVVAGPHVVPGYLGGLGDEETKIRVGSRVWHRTGDVGRLDARGRLWLLGRAAAVADDRHGTFYPFAVECAARACLGLRRLAALALDGRRLLVIERSAESAGIGLDVARRALAWAALDEIVSVRRLPTDRRHNSKIDYPALEALLRGARAPRRA